SALTAAIPMCLARSVMSFQPIEVFGSWPAFPRTTSSSATCRDPLKHAFDAEIFIEVGPVNSLPIADDFVIVSLLRSRVTQSPRPCQRHTDDAPIHKMESNQIIGNAYLSYPRVSINRNAHATSPASWLVLPE